LKRFYDGDKDVLFLMGNMQLPRKEGKPKFEKEVTLPNDESQISVAVRVNEWGQTVRSSDLRVFSSELFQQKHLPKHPDEPLKNKSCRCQIAFVCPVEKKIVDGGSFLLLMIREDFAFTHGHQKTV
jgi:hypothetical protein